MAEIQEFISQKAQTQVDNYKKDIIEIAKSYDSLIKSSTKLQSQRKTETANETALIKQKRELEKLEQDKLRTDKLVLQNEVALTKALDQESRALARKNKAIQDSNSQYKKLSKQLTESRNKAKDLGVQFGTNSKQFKAAQKEVQKLDNQLKKIDSSLGQNQRNVGNYTGALKNMGSQLLGTLGVVGGMQMFVSSIRKVITVSREYEKSNAVLAGVLGQTKSETRALMDESQRLGATTAFTASEVATLQTELARLGKNEGEIIAMTEGIISASVALSSEAGETAALVGATLNAWQMEAGESSKVADVLTLSTQKSALSFDKLNTALPIVAGAAAAAGVSLEETVAQLGQAADRGIDASTSATSLRNIYIELAKSGMTLDESLKEINSSQDKLATANELFGKRAAVTALALAETTIQTNTLANALENAGGTAEQVAATQLDTFDGSVRLMNSAIEGLIISLSDSKGFQSFTRSIVEIVTTIATLLTALINIGDQFEKTNGKSDELRSSIDKLKISFGDEKRILEESDVARQKLIESLQEEGLAYNEAKKQADDYIASLEFFADETNLLSFELSRLQAQRELLNKAGESTFEIDQKILNIQDKLKFSKIDLKNATLDELEAYANQYNITLMTNDATREFIKNLEAEIALRKQNTETIKAEQKSKSDLSRIERENQDVQVEYRAKEQEERSEMLISAEEGALRQADLGMALSLQRQEMARQEVVNQLEYDRIRQESGINAALNIATAASNLLNQNSAAGKVAALTEAAISGYLGAQKAFTETPGPIFVKIAAAASAASFSAKNIRQILGVGTASTSIEPPTELEPLPAFAEGTESTPSGAWIAGEAGREIEIDKRGHVSMIDKPTLFTDRIGSTILSNPVTEKIMQESGRPQSNNINLDEVVKAIENNTPIMGINKFGIITISKKNKALTKHINDRYRN